jgi:uncharacterized protein
MTVLAVAALSARVMAESAKAGGYEVISLDLFGDQDTTRASLQCWAIGEPAAMQIDPERVLAALDALAARGDVAGWVAGSGFERHADLIEQGEALLPLLGSSAAAVRRVRDPGEFFGFLSRRGIGHPEVRTGRPADSSAWLLKDAHGCGGWHIRRALSADTGEAPRHHYFQREVAGIPMSATFIADGRRAQLLGFNEQIVRPVGGRPFVYGGVVGPVPLPDRVAAGVSSALQALVAEFSVRGLGSLDFMLDGDDTAVLELNPRPPASMFLYDSQVLRAPPGRRFASPAPRGGESTRERPVVDSRGLMHAQVRACLHGELPEPVWRRNAAVAGSEIVFARRSMRVTPSIAGRLAARPHVHDLPHAPTAMGAGDPVCSVSARGAHSPQVRALLRAARDELLDELETAT